MATQDQHQSQYGGDATAATSMADRISSHDLDFRSRILETAPSTKHDEHGDEATSAANIYHSRRYFSPCTSFSDVPSSPVTNTFLSTADTSITPVSAFDDSLPFDSAAATTCSLDSLKAAAFASAGAGLGIAANADHQAASKGAMSLDAADPAARGQHVQPPAAQEQITITSQSIRDEARRKSQIANVAENLISPMARRQGSASASATARAGGGLEQEHEPAAGPKPRDPVQTVGQHRFGEIATASDDESKTSISPVDPDLYPLRTASALPAEHIIQPKPISRSTSNASAFPRKRSIPDSSSPANLGIGNVAHLEATAERLSETASIDEAIRDLHGELKRSDSKRSSVLASSLKASCPDEDAFLVPSLLPSLQRHLSNSSSIVSTNIAARSGGYSPGGFLLSPNPSSDGRLRSASNGRPNIDLDTQISRHGPGKASNRSIRSTVPSLAEISETEPISLDQSAMDEADSRPPIDQDPVEFLGIPGQDLDDMPTTDAFHQMLDNGFEHDGLDHGERHLQQPSQESLYDHEILRAGSFRSFDEGVDPFVDFDGVHWQPNEGDFYAPPDVEPKAPAPRRGPRPQSYIDPATGQQMLYYPAPVPAMLNLPPKLSSRPKAAERNVRRSQILGAMVQTNRHSMLPEFSEHTDAFGAERSPTKPEPSRASWLPDPLAGHRESFAAFSTVDQSGHADLQPAPGPDPVPQFETSADPAPDGLRRPRKLSRTAPEKRKSRMSRMSELPSQLRASAFFDMPSESPEVQVRDGSAMATLESILDASANAPVNAFTDHVYAGKLGSETYGKQKKRQSKAPPLPPTIRPVSSGQDLHKRSSSTWFGKRSSSYNGALESASGKLGHRNTQSASALGPVHGDIRDDESQALTGSIDNESFMQRQTYGTLEEQEEEEESEDGEAPGGPSTLLAELQLRKKHQKKRTQLSKQFPDGMHATLLEMDTIAELQRKSRQGHRVNLAWEDPDAHLDQSGSDDEDVPLAIIAAKKQGAKNLADLDRPVGLMEMRELEENEPLSRRRARLQGVDTMPMTHHKRQSMMTLATPSRLGNRSPASHLDLSTEQAEEDVDGETLGERKRRLAAMDEAEGRIPPARPVSSSFSAELLGQFGEQDLPKDESAPGKDAVSPAGPPEEETLGQRRRRLQAEREARQREMSYGTLVGENVASQNHNRRLSMADVLSAHPRKSLDLRAEQERARAEEQARQARQQEAKMAAMRNSMPTALKVSYTNRANGFRGGVYNDGVGGLGASSNQLAWNNQQGGYPAPYQHGRSASAMSGQGPYNMMPPAQPPAYNQVHPYGMNAYVQPNMSMPMPMPMPAQQGPGSMDRVERWRQGILP